MVGGGGGGGREAFTGRREKESRLLESKNMPKVPAFLTKTTRERPRLFVKLNLPESNEIPDQAMDYEGKGYRLIDIGKFSASFSEAHVCDEGKKACNLLHVFIIFMFT